MPELAGILNRLTHHDCPQLTRSLLRFHALRAVLATRIDIRFRKTGMQQTDHNALLLQIHSHALADAIHGRFAGPICVRPAAAVIANAAYTAADDADY